ncbi:MAG: hypothetical protein LLF96_10995, partial [Eubacteriales bacterium]|nr:hypothetical protein [Eubacteriales bacterium]
PIIAALEAMRADPALIASIKAERHHSGDPGREHWLRAVEEHKDGVKRIREMLDDPDMDHVPGAKRR